MTESTSPAAKAARQAFAARRRAHRDRRADQPREQDDDDGAADVAGGDDPGDRREQGIGEAHPDAGAQALDQPAGRDIRTDRRQRHRQHHHELKGEPRLPEQHRREQRHHGHVRRRSLARAHADVVPGRRVGLPPGTAPGRCRQQGTALEPAVAPELAGGDRGRQREHRRECRHRVTDDPGDRSACPPGG